MDVSELAIRVLLLFLPGIICHFVVDALTVHRERQSHQIFLLGFVYGVLAYLTYDVFLFLLRPLLMWLFGLPAIDVVFLKSLTDPKVAISFPEVGWVSLVGGLLGLAVSAGINHRWLHRLARWLRVSRLSGNLSVWSFAMGQPEVRWATVRDLDHKFMFCGYIRNYSDVDEVAELLLTDVIVYNEVTGEELYRANALYLARKRDSLTIEFPIPSGQPEVANEREEDSVPGVRGLHDEGGAESAECEPPPPARPKRKRRSRR